ncbi:pullulanase-type alpha-1,6-glucosidase [Cellulosimicrobium arenosum]|uniref:Pullulanase-type alpha-1,6-glucosidase n=2 Tax=Cellulosimicrobium arenosum TaxID=2708133 RepID=A0A927IZ83_9MICO|nr:pullulanase-type alpha-1,6-glucosidase [Cellulosimicrobium arenosum]MBD8078264.1 pullulanase-type alpha-1,6-glucosidase [Cellulosimicrobium arenosum]
MPRRRRSSPIAPGQPSPPRASRAAASVAALALASSTLAGLTVAAMAAPAAGADERSAALVGDLQSELGCAADWDPACAATDLAPSDVPGVWSAEFEVPAGSWEYKVAMDDAWDEAYGRDGRDENVPLVLGGDTRVRVTFDESTGRIALTPLDLAGEDEAADAALVAPPVRQPGSDERFYFVMTDRFANGDTSNDTAGLGDDRLESGFDPTDKGFYQGGDIAGLRENLDYVEGLGTTAIWLTPSFTNQPVQGSGADVSAGYHGYWITDFTQIDPHLGANAELEGLVDEAHAKGIKVYFDIITNHTADVVDYEEDEYSYVDQATSPYRDAAGDVFDPAAVAGTGDFPQLDAATSFPYTPFVPPGKEDLKVPSWLNDPTVYHNRGNSTWTGESVTYGDFDGLDDLMTEDPRVVDGFVDVYEDWIDLGIDGFRIDTVKHVNVEFWETWTTEVLDYAHAQGKDDFFMFGEVYDADAAKLSPYVRRTDMSSTLDFTFQSAATSFASGNSAKGLASLFASDDMYTTPDTSASALPTFLGNHDMGRVGYLLASTDDPLARDELAHDLMYLTRGQPVVYYGDEQGFAGRGGDKDARQTLFATQVDEYADQPLVTGEQAGSVDRYDTDAPLYERIADLAALRAAHPALATGAQVERYVENGAGVYAFSRVDRTERVEHLVALNNAAEPREATFTTLTPGARYDVLYGDGEPATASADGSVTLTVPATSAVVLVADREVGADSSGEIAVTVPAAGAATSGVAPVGATVDDDAWSETSIAWREVGASGWHALGTAEDTTPRVFHDVTSLPEGTLVEYRAVTTDADGDRAAASSFASVGVDVSGTVGEEPEPEIDLVTVAGSHNSEMGCAGDWAPGCEAAKLTKRADGVYAGTFDLPAGTYEYKVALNGSWTVNYGVGGVQDGDNATYTTDGGPVTFYWDPVGKDFSSTAQGPIVTVAGSFQDQVGCPGTWAPDCLASWLKDPDGDGTYTWSTDALSAGAYEGKVAHGTSWAENYGVGGAPDGANYQFSVGDGETVTFTYDIETHVLEIGVENPPLPGAGLQAAHWVRDGLLAWPGSLGAGDTYTLWTAPEGGLFAADGAVDAPDGAQSYPLEVDPGGLPDDVVADFPALAEHTALRPVGADGQPLARADVEAALTGQLLVTRTDGTTLSAATGVQVPGVVDDLFAQDAAARELGVTWHGLDDEGDQPSFALWAPTAQDVALLAWPAGTPLADDPTRFEATRQSDGTWTLDGAASDEPSAGERAGWEGTRYLYEVTVYVPSTGKVETNVVTDPYSVGLTLDSTHSVAVDLDDPAFRPPLWEDTAAPVVERSVDQTIYELHVRDFSIADETVPAAERGTYLAFAEEGSDGMTHLRELADAGMTTVHLLPTFDIASIPEDRADQATTGDLSGFAPDSTEQQAAVAGIQAGDGFNWGYDPWHFSTPEGSYATDADGGARVAEFRTMVGALHDTGLQVVLDQVFNHTAASGQDEKSVLDKVVPGYYHRQNPTTGSVETSTCCQNVATEHAMAGRLMVDSVVTWAKDYHVDGFRFDLMGHHSRQNMLDVRAALDELTLAEDGVDGKSVYLYGEGWNFGEVADDTLFEQATQGNLGGTGVGTFSDRLRDAVHGGSPVDGASTFTQGFGTGLGTDPNGREATADDPGSVNDGSDDELADLGHQTDLVRLGLAGNLRDFTFVTSTGQEQRGDEIDYRGAPAGYADSPEEVVTYVDAHDNETLFDLLALKLPADTPMDERVRMNTVSLATTALSQSPSFWHAGTDLLRSKSLDRNSYDSGDWFNAIDWSGQDNGFGKGLPMAADNEDRWPLMAPLLADAALEPAPADIATASAQADDLLRLRHSTELFRLGDAGAIQQKVTFPDAGADQAPSVIVMSVDDTAGADDVDPALDGVLAVLNASPDPVTQTIEALAGRDYALSPVQAEGSDDVVKDTTWDAGSGTVTVPARTVAVLVEPQAGAEAPVTVEAVSRCLAGKAYVAVRATNDGPVPLGIALSTPFGTRSFADVAPGKNAYQSFAVRAASVEAGEATVAVTQVDPLTGADVTTTVAAAFEPRSCS